jgi:hypothetical protein
MATPSVGEVFLNSPWYADLIFVLQNLEAPPGLTKTKARFFEVESLEILYSRRQFVLERSWRHSVELFTKR